MATESVVRAVQLKVAALTPALFPGGAVPAVYFGEAPTTDAAGAQVQVSGQGYAVLRDRGAQAGAYSFNLDTREFVTLELEVFYPTLADAQQAAKVIRLNGGSPANRQGLDYGTLPDLSPAYRLLAVRPVGAANERAGLGKTGGTVHSVTLTYRVELVRLA